MLKSKKASSKQSNYAFIDSQNLNLGIKSQGWTLDFQRFRIYLRDKYKVKKAFLFIGYIPKNEKMYNSLTRAGYVLVYKPVLESKNKSQPIKGNIDAELVLHATIEYPNYDQAVIISGDGDFHCLVEYLEKKRKLKRLLIPNQKKYSGLFLKFKGYIDFLNNQKLKLGTKNGSVALKTKQ